MLVSSSFETITTPPTTIDLTTLATAKLELGITDGSQDVDIARWIHQASSIIASSCNRIFGRQTVIESWRLREHTDLLVLKYYPIAIVSAVTDGGVALTSADYDLDAKAGLIRRVGQFWRMSSGTDPSVEISYQGGYILISELPHDLETACLKLLSYRVRGGNRDPAVRSESLGGVYSVSYAAGSSSGQVSSLPSDVEDILVEYRERPI